MGTPTPGTVPDPAKATLSPQWLPRPERPGLAEGVRGRERRTRLEALGRPSPPASSPLDLDGVAEARRSPGPRASRRPSRGNADPRRPSRGRRRGSASGRARSTTAVPRVRARGRTRVGFVTRNDGSDMSRPSSITSRNTWSHARPKWMVWWAVGCTSRVDPACSRKHDGEYVSRRGDRSRAVAWRRRSGLSTTASHGTRSPSDGHHSDGTVRRRPRPGRHRGP